MISGIAGWILIMCVFAFAVTFARWVGRHDILHGLFEEDEDYPYNTRERKSRITKDEIARMGYNTERLKW